MRRSALLPVLAAAALLALPLSACSTGGASSMPDVSPMDSSGGVGISEGTAGDAGSAEAGGSGGVDAEAASRSIIRTGSLSLQVADPEAAADEVAAVATELGGAVDELSVSHDDERGGAGASLTIRVPADRLDDAFDALGGIGTVLDQSRTAEDVTSEHVDLQARVDALQASVDRLTALMADASSTSALLEAEAALSERQAELDGLTAQLRSLEGQVDQATVWVSLSTRSALPGGGPANFWEGLLAGVDSVVAAGAGLLVALGILLPWLAVAAVVALVVVLIVRGARRRRRARTAHPAPQPDPAPQSAPQHAPQESGRTSSE